MNPVPFFQVVDFLDWLNTRQHHRENQLNPQYVYEMALVYLRDNRGESATTYDLTYILKIFQSCPMVTEGDIQGQIAHYAKCGQCLEYIRQKNINPRLAQLHPLLQEFSRYAERQGFTRDVRERVSSIQPRTSRRLEEDDVFRQIINEVGAEFGQIFKDYLQREAPQSLIQDYLQSREGASQRNRISSDRERSRSDDGTSPLWAHGNDVEMEARRLADSVRLAMENSFYENQIQNHPEFRRLVRALGIMAEHSIQAIEFISWLQDRHSKLDILASIPTNQIQQLVIEFCEAKNYQNAASFSAEVTKWMGGKGEKKILQRLIDIGTQIKRRNKTYRPAVSPFSRYQTIPFHAVYLFLSVGDFPKFIQTYWEDLNSLTGDHLDVYYSFEDVERKVSAFDTVNEFRSLTVKATSLPAILIWKQSLSDHCIIPLEKLSHTDVFDITKLIVQQIAEGKDLPNICAEAKIVVNEKLEALSPTPKLIIQGDLTMSTNEIMIGDNATIYGDVVAAHSIQNSFNKAASAEIPDDLKDLLKQLATAVGKMSESLPKETAQQAARDLDTLVAEATSKAPRKAWWQLSVDGLKKAAENIGAIGKPVIELAGKIVSILIGMPS
ncbi:MAG: hypothetical protein HY808_13565 [Nitrospirae bacterium]|nr:hypothetical protein [Nitrospirota bacterium]